MNRKTESLIFIDGGDPNETQKAKELMGYIDGQTTNPTLISKNPEIKQRIKSGNLFTEDELLDEYKKIVQEVAKATDGPTSIEVYADKDTKAEDMIAQAREMAAWIPNAYIKLPIIPEGLKAAKELCPTVKLNMTLCFSQEQAAAVYAATVEAPYPVFVSPFVGRLDDKKENGMDVVANIISMFEASDKHVKVLTASVRNKNHLLYALMLKSYAITLPFSVFKDWAVDGFEIPTLAFVYDQPHLQEIPYKQIPLDNEWNSYDIKHPLTDIGLSKFSEDWKKLLKK